MSFSVDELCFDEVTADPTPAVAGMFWYRSDLGKLRYYPPTLVAEDVDTGGGVSEATVFSLIDKIQTTRSSCLVQVERSTGNVIHFR